MIPRARSASSAAALHLAPRGGAADWHPVEPRGGWTPDAATDASDDYAEGDRATRIRAYAALLRAVPGLHRTDVLTRLRGRDVLGELEGRYLAPADSSRPSLDPIPF